MQRFRKRAALALALLAVCLAATAARAQDPKPAPPADDNVVSGKGFSNEIFEVKNRDPLALMQVLQPLGSGFKGSTMRPNQEFHTITVRDFPENLAIIREAIRRLDTPQPPRPSIEFHVHLLVGTNDPTATGDLPPQLNDIVRQLRATLGYKNFSVMGSQMMRSKEERGGDVYNKGVADLKVVNAALASANPVFYEYHLRSFSVAEGGGPARIMIEDFNLSLRMPLLLSPDKVAYEQVGFRNPVSLREGERVVAGTTSVGDKSVIVILTATTMK
jgi:hypothetical protein